LFGLPGLADGFFQFFLDLLATGDVPVQEEQDDDDKDKGPGRLQPGRGLC